MQRPTLARLSQLERKHSDRLEERRQQRGAHSDDLGARLLAVVTLWQRDCPEGAATLGAILDGGPIVNGAARSDAPYWVAIALLGAGADALEAGRNPVRLTPEVVAGVLAATDEGEGMEWAQDLHAHQGLE